VVRKKAVIVGSNGQDGFFLKEELIARNYDVLGIDCGFLESAHCFSFDQVDILRYSEVEKVLVEYAPDEIYYLAAFHHSSQAAERMESPLLLQRSFGVHVAGLHHFLEAIRLKNPKTRLFYASSSLVFGNPAQAPQTEATPLSPKCIYGITKAAGMRLCMLYRNDYSVFSTVGILYNHESHLRSDNFLSKKIINAGKRIRAGEEKELIVGDLSAETDWGYSPDFVNAMWRILQLETPDDFIISTGTSHKVLDWITIVFDNCGLDWKHFVKEDSSLLSRKKGNLIGDYSKLNRETGWKPTTSFNEMVIKMLQEV
jgi:GDPmannose 4,6-dehydratase